MIDSNRKPSAKAKDWPKGSPIVLAVQPTKFEVVTPNELKDWEASHRESHLKAGGTGTWSFSPIGGGYDTFDDSDYIP